MSTFTGTTTNTLKTVTGIASTTGIWSGQMVTGTGIPANTHIDTIDSGTQITLDQAATASGTVTLTALVDWQNPVTTSRYEGVPQQIRALDAEAASLFTNGDDVTNLPNYIIKWDGTRRRFRQYFASSYSDLPTDNEWLSLGLTPTVVAGGTFRVTGDKRSLYSIGRAIAAYDGTTLFPCHVNAVSYDGTNTYVTGVFTKSLQTIAPTDVFLGIQADLSSTPRFDSNTAAPTPTAPLTLWDYNPGNNMSVMRGRDAFNQAF